MEAWYEEPVHRLVRGRRVILAGGVPPAWAATHDVVRRLGALDVAVLATEGRGAGAGPDCTTIVVEPPPGLDLMGRIRWGNAALAELPPHAVAALDEFDPTGDAVVLGTFLAETPTVGGRPLLNHRRPEWVALEDKTVVDDLWRRAGVPAAPAATVPLDAAPDAARALDRGHGTVWAADATTGWHGGATLTEWVRSHGDVAEATRALRPSWEGVRVMPFLEGVPCSVHGIVCADGVVALRPVEMVTLRQDRRFVYAGCATFWDPPSAIRDAMRDAARAVGERLAADVAYRGAFTVDGVATSDGFRPTELNPRPGAGLATMGRGLPEGFPLLLVIDMIAAGHDMGRTAEQIEADLLAATDAARAGGTGRHAPIEPSRPADGERLRFDGRRWASDDQGGGAARTGTVLATNGFVRCTFDAHGWPVGPSVAPAAAAFYRWCDDELGTAMGELTPAPDVTAA